MHETDTLATSPSANANARDRFVSDLQSLSTHAQELLHVTSTVSGEGVAAAREQLKESVRIARENLKQLQGEALERGREIARQADTYVRGNPWQALVVGVAAGLFLGFASSSATRGVTARA
ncbi:MAG: DUF883 family protein [Panacagrimonas sp.]